MKQKLKLHFCFDVFNDKDEIDRSDIVNSELKFDNEDPPNGFISCLESFFQSLLFQFVPGYPFHKTLKVTRLDIKSSDWIIIESERGAVHEADLEKLAKTFCEVVSRCEVICVNPGRGKLEFTAIGKEEKKS